MLVFVIEGLYFLLLTSQLTDQTTSVHHRVGVLVAERSENPGWVVSLQSRVHQSGGGDIIRQSDSEHSGRTAHHKYLHSFPHTRNYN